MCSKFEFEIDWLLNKKKVYFASIEQQLLYTNNDKKILSRFRILL